MRILFSEFKKKRVETQSGVHVGRVIDVVLDEDQFSIVQFKVRRPIPSRTILMVHPGQVKRIEEKRLIVADAVIRKELGAPETPIAAIEPLVSAETE